MSYEIFISNDEIITMGIELYGTKCEIDKLRCLSETAATEIIDDDF